MSVAEHVPVARRPINRASVYVLPVFRNGRAIADGSNRAAYNLCVEYENELPQGMAQSFAALRAEEDRAHQRDRQWARDFIHACARGGVDGWPDGSGRMIFDQGEMSTKMLTLGRLWRVREVGVTYIELQQYYGKISGGFPGALSTLHAAGVLDRLATKR